MTQSSGQFVEHIPCPSCGSSDALAVYQQEDGSHNATCWSCKKFNPNPYDEEQANKEPRNVHMDATQEQLNLIAQGGAFALTDRGISAEVAERFGVKVAIGDDGHISHHYYPVTKQGKITGYKIRSVADKQFTAYGDVKKCELFGQQQARESGGKKLIITEGECDAMALYQAIIESRKGGDYEKYVPAVVSITKGASTAKAEILAQTEFLSLFEEVVLVFDQDEAGKDATDEAGRALPPGLAKTVKLSGKDPNEMLQAGKGAQLTKEVLWQARDYRPDGIKTISELRGVVLKDTPWGLGWPWPSLDPLTYGIQSPAIYTIGAGSGVGKTEGLKDLIHHITYVHQELAGVFFLEETPGITGKVLLGKRVGKKFHIPATESNPWTQEELEAAYDIMEAENRIQIYDSHGQKSFSKILDDMRYMALVGGVKYMFLDHLTALSCKEGDERRAIDSMMADLASLVESLGITLFLVSHLTRPGGVPHEEGGRVTQASFRGSGSIAFWSHYMIGFERNTQAESPTIKGTTYLRWLKDRLTGQATGTVLPLSFKSGSLVEADEEHLTLLKAELDAAKQKEKERGYGKQGSDQSYSGGSYPEGIRF